MIEEKDSQKDVEKSEDEEVKDPEMKKFLKNIDLSDEKERKDAVIIDFED